MISLAIKLILAHLIGDFLLQPQKWVKHKNKHKHKSKYLYLHIGIHAFALLLLLQFKTRYWLGFIIIIASHYIIDLLKLHLQNKSNKRWAFAIDQTAHIIVIALAIEIYEPYFSNLETVNYTWLLLLISCVIAITSMSAVVMKTIISRWDVDTQKNDDALENAGTIIGMLERLFVFLFVILGFWEGIGFLLAAKSIFRFGDLSRAKDRKLTEYVLIGTLISFGLAIGIGLLYVSLLSNIVQY